VAGVGKDLLDPPKRLHVLRMCAPRGRLHLSLLGQFKQSIQERYGQKVERYLATYDDSDLASIASYAPSILSEDSSISSFSSNPSRGSPDKLPSALLEGVEHILAEPFLSNATLGPAYVAAIENIGNLG
jgi:hypothetical protein